MNTMLISLYL